LNFANFLEPQQVLDALITDLGFANIQLLQILKLTNIGETGIGNLCLTEI
jgi:hypothetical protein